ncbi:MAG: hypothetical protein IJB67_05290 [Firmicutes bacterium]|nr:hypothetical protein [Bacillota bacterium]
MSVETTTKTIVFTSDRSDYGTMAKEVVAAFMELCPEATIQQVNTDTTSVYDVVLKIGNDGWYIRHYNSGKLFYHYMGYMLDGVFTSVTGTSQSNIVTSSVTVYVEKRAVNSDLARYQIYSSSTSTGVRLWLGFGQGACDGLPYTLLYFGEAFPVTGYVFGGGMSVPESLNFPANKPAQTPAGMTILAPATATANTFSLGYITFANEVIYCASVHPNTLFEEFYCGDKKFVLLYDVYGYCIAAS